MSTAWAIFISSANFFLIKFSPYICLNAKDHRTFWNSTDNNVEVTANFAFNLPFSLGFYIPYILKRLPCGPCRKSYEKLLKFTHTWHFLSNPCCLSLIKQYISLWRFVLFLRNDFNNLPTIFITEAILVLNALSLPPFFKQLYNIVSPPILHHHFYCRASAISSFTFFNIQKYVSTGLGD